MADGYVGAEKRPGGFAGAAEAAADPTQQLGNLWGDLRLCLRVLPLVLDLGDLVCLGQIQNSLGFASVLEHAHVVARRLVGKRQFLLDPRQEVPVTKRFLLRRQQFADADCVLDAAA